MAESASADAPPRSVGRPDARAGESRLDDGRSTGSQRSPERRIERLLTPAQLDAARELVQRVHAHVPAGLFRALLFGSRARGEARPDSDVDVLLVFHDLPPDREPHATIAEEVADRLAEETGVPVQPWSVSLDDLRCGWRTPMLVDALDDGVPLWPEGAPPLRIEYTPRDALFCATSLLRRVDEGSDEVARALDRGDVEAAAERARDDLVRLCSAALLLDGETRPRRADAVRRFVDRNGSDPAHAAVLAWAARSFGANGGAGGGRDGAPIPPPPGGIAAAGRAVDALAALVAGRAARLRARLDGNRGEDRM